MDALEKKTVKKKRSKGRFVYLQLRRLVARHKHAVGWGTLGPGKQAWLIGYRNWDGKPVGRRGETVKGETSCAGIRGQRVAPRSLHVKVLRLRLPRCQSPLIFLQKPRSHGTSCGIKKRLPCQRGLEAGTVEAKLWVGHQGCHL